MTTRTQKSLLPLVAVGGSLAGMPASALELGEMTVQSRLGQPLRASIAFALAQNEQLANSCVTLGATASGLPGIGRATVSVGDGVILLTGKMPIREPMVAANIAIDCAYTANLSREYMLFIDPPAPIVDTGPAIETAPTQVTEAAAASTSPVTATRRAAPVRKVNRESIANGTPYRVEFGDTLGDIAARIENRPIGLWSAVDKIFAANPDAFINNDPNKLKAGSWLTIPSLDGSAPVVTAAAPPTTSYVDRAAPSAAALPSSSASTMEAPAIAATPAIEVANPETVTSSSDTTFDLSPGDVILDSDNPFVETDATTNESIVIPDTELPGPTTSASSPNVPTATIDAGSKETSTPWLMWLAGSGIVMIIGLLLFGRRFRDRNSAPPLDAHPTRRATDDESYSGPTPAAANYDLEDDSPTEENLTLDADLVVGTGLDDGTDIDVSQDFGFASPTEVDIELPFEPEAEVSSKRFSEDTILESEILPDDEDYDLSVILDATKMPQAEDVTERDLNAVEVPDEDSGDTDAYTINREVDLNILEQDYEDELTATQALNVEIARAALELDDDANGDAADDDTTEAPSLATVTDLDITVQMPPREEVNDELSDEDYLVETATVMMTGDEGTVDMPSAENDDSTDMDIDGEVDTKAV